MAGEEEKMSVETLWILFACVSMSLFGYAFLKPMCAGFCSFKSKRNTRPVQPAVIAPVAEPVAPIKTIKIHPARAQFQLFPPGEARYVCMPRRHVEPKVKKKKKPKKLNDKWKQCVQSIVASNAIRDLASASPRPAFFDGPDGEEHSAPKDPRVFSGLSSIANGRLKLNETHCKSNPVNWDYDYEETASCNNCMSYFLHGLRLSSCAGGPINNFAKIVQLARLAAQREQEEQRQQATENTGPGDPEGHINYAYDPEKDTEPAVEIKDDADDAYIRAFTLRRTSSSSSCGGGPTEAYSETKKDKTSLNPEDMC